MAVLSTLGQSFGFLSFTFCTFQFPSFYILYFPGPLCGLSTRDHMKEEGAQFFDKKTKKISVFLTKEVIPIGLQSCLRQKFFWNIYMEQRELLLSLLLLTKQT